MRAARRIRQFLIALCVIPVGVLPVSFGLPLGNAALAGMINVTLNELHHDGTLERILRKHEAFPGTFLRIGKPYSAVAPAAAP